MDNEIKDQLMEWYLRFGEWGVLSAELDESGLDNTDMFNQHEGNGGELVADSTPNESYAETIWVLTPLALEIIKGKRE